MLSYLKPQINFNLKELDKKKITSILSNFDNQKIWIMKPVSGFAGKGIKVLENKVDLIDYVKEIKKNKN